MGQWNKHKGFKNTWIIFQCGCMCVLYISINLVLCIVYAYASFYQMHENVDFLFRDYINIIIYKYYLYIYMPLRMIAFDSTRNSTQVLGCIDWKDTIFIFAADFLRLQRNHK